MLFGKKFVFFIWFALAAHYGRIYNDFSDENRLYHTNNQPLEWKWNKMRRERGKNTKWERTAEKKKPTMNKRHKNYDNHLYAHDFLVAWNCTRKKYIFQLKNKRKQCKNEGSERKKRSWRDIENANQEIIIFECGFRRSLSLLSTYPIDI